jgi:tetratricopeptide (TPR) repeat protein
VVNLLRESPPRFAARARPRYYRRRRSRPYLDIRLPYMNKNLILCLAGVAVGFLVGFIAANAISQQTPSDRASKPAQAASRGGASDIDESSGGQLPPGHPDVGGASGGGSAASTCAPAQAAMEQADSNPSDFAAQAEAGKVFYKLNDYDKAELYLARALDLNPTDFGALKAMGDTKYDRGDYAAAATFYERALAINPKDPDVRTDYGNTFALRQPPDLDRAVAEYQKAVNANPDHEMGWYFLATASVEKKDKATARKALARLEAINPQNSSLPSLRESVNALP